MRTRAARIVALAGALGAALAASSPAAAQPARPQASPPGSTKKAPVTRSASGVVKSISADAIVVTGRDKGKAAEWTFALEPGTKLTKSGKAIPPSDLKPGDAVQVRYVEEAGRSTAQSVIVRPSKRP